MAERLVEFCEEDFEQLRIHHGWSVKIERAARCSCYNETTGSADYKCPYCLGKGWIFSPLDFKRVYDIVGIFDKEKSSSENKLLYTLPECPKGCSYDSFTVERAYNKTTGETLVVLNVSGTEIEVIGSQEIKSDHKILFDLAVSTKESIVDEKVIKVYAGVVRVESPIITRVTSLVNSTTSEVYSIKAVTDDKIYYDYTNAPASTDIVLATYERVPLHKCIVSSVDMRINRENVGEIKDGDLSMSFSREIVIGQRYKITLYTGEQTSTDILIKGDDNKLKYNNVTRIINVSTNTKTFSNNDYSLIGDRQIKFLTPEIQDGSQVSVIYQYRPEYIVWKDLPQIRHQEDKNLLRRVLVRKYEVFNKSAQTNKEPYPTPTTNPITEQTVSPGGVTITRI